MSIEPSLIERLVFRIRINIKVQRWWHLLTYVVLYVPSDFLWLLIFHFIHGVWHVVFFSSSFFEREHDLKHWKLKILLFIKIITGANDKNSQGFSRFFPMKLYANYLGRVMTTIKIQETFLTKKINLEIISRCVSST